MHERNIYGNLMYIHFIMYVEIGIQLYKLIILIMHAWHFKQM